MSATAARGRSMLARVTRIEAAGLPVLSPFEAACGSLDGWEAHCRTGIDAGHLDGCDVPLVMLAVRRWHDDNV